MPGFSVLGSPRRVRQKCKGMAARGTTSRVANRFSAALMAGKGRVPGDTDAGAEAPSSRSRHERCAAVLKLLLETASIFQRPARIIWRCAATAAAERIHQHNKSRG